MDLPDDATVSADRAMIAAILSNLLANAIEYSPTGGAVAVAVRRTRYAVELAVSNTNGSLAAGDLAHLLQPFWRKDAARTDPLAQRPRAGTGRRRTRGCTGRSCRSTWPTRTASASG